MGGCIGNNGYQPLSGGDEKPTQKIHHHYRLREEQTTIPSLHPNPRPVYEYTILGKPFEDIRIPYTFGKKLGRDEFSVSRLCTEKSTGHTYSCKSILKKFVRNYDVDLIKRGILIREHLGGHHHNHNSIVEFKGAYEDEKFVHLVTEYCVGGTLLARIVKKKKGRFTEKAAATIFRQIANAVYACHSMGVVHRDLNPENFMLSSKDIDQDAVLKVTGFNSAAIIEQGKVFAGIGSKKLHYIAPEILRGEFLGLDGREIDIWSAGVILYILLSGVPPFWAETGDELLTVMLDGFVDFRHHPWPLISKRAKDLVSKMLTKNPRERITSAQVLDHPWLKQASDIDSEELKQSGVINKLKKLVFKSIDESLSEEEDIDIDIEELLGMKKSWANNKLKKLAFKLIDKCLYVEDDIKGRKPMFVSMDTYESALITI